MLQHAAWAVLRFQDFPPTWKPSLNSNSSKTFCRSGYSFVRPLWLLLKPQHKGHEGFTKERTLSTSLRIGFLHRVNKNFFQRRFHQFEAIDAHLAGNFTQEYLRIRSWRQLQFRVAPIAIE